jgi:hypothetical protein
MDINVCGASLGLVLRKSSVSVMPGQTTLIRIPSGPQSSASVLEKPMIAALDAEYVDMPLDAFKPAKEATLTMLPRMLRCPGRGSCLAICRT